MTDNGVNGLIIHFITINCGEIEIMLRLSAQLFVCFFISCKILILRSGNLFSEVNLLEEL